MFVGKHPPNTGRFYKDVIAGHIGTARLAGNPDFHAVYHNGQSHYFIDGTVSASGRVLVLAHDEEKGTYSKLR